jgi:hypothetical protein
VAAGTVGKSKAEWPVTVLHVAVTVLTVTSLCAAGCSDSADSAVTLSTPWLQDHIMKTPRRSLTSTLNEDKQSASRSSLFAPAKSPRNPLGGTPFQWQECVFLYHGLKFYISVAAGSSVGILLSYLVDCSSLGVLVSYLVGCSSVGLFVSYLVGCSSVGIHLSSLVGCSSLGIFMSYLDGCISVGTLLSYVVVWKASRYTWKLCNAANGSLSAWNEHLCENVWL